MQTDDIEDKIKIIIKKCKNINPKANLSDIAKYFNIIKIFLVRYSNCSPTWKGYLIPSKGGFIIKINKSLSKIEQRKTCAHEFVHTLFYNVSLGYPRKWFLSDIPGNVEDICDEIIDLILSEIKVGK